MDANFITARVDVWADLANPLPFRDATVDASYSHRVIEHLPAPVIASLFNEMYRCLKPGGMIRIGGPDGDTAIRKFLENDKAWFGDWPDKHESIGGRFAISFFVEANTLRCSHGRTLRNLVGMRNLKMWFFCAPVVETNHPALIGERVLSKQEKPTPSAPHTVILEGIKPALPRRASDTYLK